MNRSFARSSVRNALVLSFIFDVIALGGVSSAVAQPAEVEPVAPIVAPEPVSPPEADSKKEEASEKFQTGVIASYGTFSKSAAVGSVNQGDVPGDKQSPITGSVSRQGDKCVVTVTNQSEKDAYAIGFDVVGMRGANRAFSKYYSARLAPKQSTEKVISACERDLNLQVAVKSGKKVGK